MANSSHAYAALVSVKIAKVIESACRRESLFEGTARRQIAAVEAAIVSGDGVLLRVGVDELYRGTRVHRDFQRVVLVARYHPDHRRPGGRRGDGSGGRC